MDKKVKNIFFYLIVIFAIYCSMIIGQSWDEASYLSLGKERLRYLFSFGFYNIKEVFWNGHHYPGISYTLNAFIVSLFPNNLEIEITHLFNLSISLSAVFGISRISRELFNKRVSIIVFVIFIFYPAFFGHMAINANDTVVTACYVWFTYLALRYLKNQQSKKRKKYLILFSIIIITGTGVRLAFMASLLPVIFFLFSDIFIFKRFINKNFSKINFFIDSIIIIILSYFLLILFWPETHTNIFILPYTFFNEMMINTQVGWPIGLVNGKFFSAHEPPTNYLLLNLIFRTPEYVLFLYLISVLLMISYNKICKKKFKDFNYKILFILLILLFPNILLFFSIFPIYDGIRLFLFILPFFVIIPSLSIFLILDKIKEIKIKIIAIFTSVLFAIFIIKFISITPYHYTYLNLFSGNFSNQYKNFENDYWGTSLKELIRKSKFINKDINKLALCGVSPDTVKFYLKKFNYSKVQIVRVDEDFDFILLTNRTTYDENVDLENTKTCFQKYRGENASEIKRYGLILSQIR